MPPKWPSHSWLAHADSHSRNLTWQLSAVTEHMPGLTSKATPLGEAARMAITFMARTHQLIQGRNLMWQLSAIAEHTPRLTSKATPLGNATKMAVAFMAGAC